MSERIVMHLDMDAFFASVEERDKPRLKGMPIVVGSDPKDGKGRGVVSTANYKAREYGIHSAEPISKAWHLSEEAARKGSPRAVFLSPNFKAYSKASREIFDYLRTQSEVLEVASIDEAYLEFKNQELNFAQAEKAAEIIKNHIKEKYKLTCSIGIGPNKLIAKIAAGFKKPDGLTVVPPDKVLDFLSHESVRVIPGIGPQSQATLLKLGARTVSDLRKIEKTKLKELFGKWGEAMYLKARGVDDSPVVSEHETKSIGEQETFEYDTLDSNFLISKLKDLAKSVIVSVKQDNFLFRTVVITVRFGDFETKNRSRTLSKAVQDEKVLKLEALRIFLPFLDKRENPFKKPIRLLGLRVEKLSYTQE